MARLLTTGFELGELVEHNGSVVGTLSEAKHQVQSTRKRTGNYAWYIDCRSTTAYICCTHTINEVSELYARMAIYVANNAGSSSNVQNFLSLFYFTNNQLSLGLRSDDMRLRVGCGSDELGQTSATVVATGNMTITAGNWYVVELHVALSGGANTYYEGSVKVNGVTDFTFAFSREGGSPYINIIKFGFNGVGIAVGGCDIYLDDIAINDTTGGYQNSWPGTGGVYLLKPNGEGTVQQWTPSEGTVHYTLVDEIPKNTTDWVYDQISGHVELFALEDLPSVTSVQLVEVVYQAALAEAGANNIRDVVRHGGNNYSGTTEAVATVAPNYKLYKGQPRYIEAGGTLPWTPAQVNALEAGIEIP